ncbi:4'-phosphopantetheinyl transferase family protein (plasmid) [Photobacterium leiognathi subsp. mandapamensis]|uniref:4'-phosphopantetheinyl transferase family protein n=1 Tax=Photobacterium leiognathi TaxID=553611 RepID=UPI003AF36852
MSPFLITSERVTSPRFQSAVLWFNAFERQYFDPSLFSDFGIDCPAPLSRATTKRQAEYFAGRLAAQRALQALACHTHEVPMGEDRLPQWPSGYRGSISHTQGLAVAVVCHRHHYQAVGIDTETVFTADQCTKLTKAIVSAVEWHDITQSGCDLSSPQLITLMFSAKEALYKALYPQTLQFQDFGAAKLTKVSAPSAQFQIELTCDWSDAYRAGTQFNGWFQFLANTVVTVIADDAFA